MGLDKDDVFGKEQRDEEINDVFGKLDMDYKDYVVQNPKFMRPEELRYLCGDSYRTRDELDWTPQYTFETMLDEMIEHWNFHFGQRAFV